MPVSTMPIFLLIRRGRAPSGAAGFITTIKYQGQFLNDTNKKSDFQRNAPGLLFVHALFSLIRLPRIIHKKGNFLG